MDDHYTEKMSDLEEKLRRSTSEKNRLMDKLKVRLTPASAGRSVPDRHARIIWSGLRDVQLCIFFILPYYYRHFFSICKKRQMLLTKHAFHERMFSICLLITTVIL